ncbi:helix-turn-helix domain-containing protein [Oceanicola sp. 502str15]|uniref:helix-turn-helix domain-containing protein n=1 Tax=Oceanicola sp. 502str15 TaxID=2696061 RepID=UPI002095F13E|nr:helix-turn-helix transcriptional regulator [Oceanicola sp. 502str15]MCO6382812.1 helix-turn-helix domain-containing protein [Oceanicola sp. 502str15]
MIERLDKRARAGLFRARTARAITEAGLSQAAVARAVGVSRSTLSQLLRSEAARLPGAQLLGDLAGALGVSADWLLGLTDRPERAAQLAQAAMSITQAERALIDDQIFAWHQEAAGYKIRHVPATLPDMLKTPEMLHWEYAPHLGKTTAQAIGAAQDRLDWMRGSGSDYEIALPLDELAAFAGGTGYYAGLPEALRREQLGWMGELHRQFYPQLRIFLFDQRRMFSAPVTVFGPLLAVLYMGSSHLAFRDKERVQAITSHFDGLVRAARVDAREWPEHVAELLRGLG